MPPIENVQVVDPKVKVFRKGLSTIVETVIEIKSRKPIWNLRNNVSSIIDKIQKAGQFKDEAMYLVDKNPLEIDAIIQEMITWYTSKKGGAYDIALVSPVCNRVTNIVVTAIGETFLLDEELKEWDAKQPK